jgi:hypothetical protein
VDGSEKDKTDRLLRDYNAVLRESAVLTTFSGILFGFLLNISVNPPHNLEIVDKVALAIALFSITLAISLFIMPVIYHHMQYPYGDFEKFKKRSHRFLLFGIIPSMVTLFLGLKIALTSLIGNLSFLLALVPFVMIYIFFRKRK